MEHLCWLQCNNILDFILIKKFIVQVSRIFHCIFEIGNLLTLSFGLSSGWATINLLELENENSTYSTGPLNKAESSNVVSFINIGGFLGNYIIIPLSRMIGIKGTIHFLGVPLVVRHNLRNNKKIICWIQFSSVYILFICKL